MPLAVWIAYLLNALTEFSFIFLSSSNLSIHLKVIKLLNLISMIMFGEQKIHEASHCEDFISRSYPPWVAKYFIKNIPFLSSRIHFYTGFNLTDGTDRDLKYRSS